MAALKESQARRGIHRASGSSNLKGLALLEGAKAIAAVKAGFDADIVRQLALQLDVSLEELAVPLHLTNRTLHRRLEQGRLEMDESERLLELIRIFALAKKVLGNEAKAVHWLKSPLLVLAGKSPLDCAETQIGLREVEDVLIRIQDVVYS